MVKAKYAITDFKTPERVLCKLKNYADKIVLTKRINTYESINGHSDIQVCKISGTEIVCAPSCKNYYTEELKGVNVISGNNEPGDKYPYDVFYNLFCNENVAIHNFLYTDSNIINLIDSRLLNKINVKQGYSKCSICGMNNNAFITDDEGVYIKLKEIDFDVLLTDKGIIELPGMEYGFIGGASGYYNGHVFFTGKINDTIKQFCYEHSTEVIELSDKKPIDVGSIIFL